MTQLPLIFDPPTVKQRHALYRFGISRHRVAMLNKTQATELLDVLIKTIPGRKPARRPWRPTTPPQGPAAPF